MWETVRLGDVCTVRRGETITRKEAVEGAVPVVGGGTKPTYFHNQPNREANCITISGSGAYAGFVNRWDVPIFASDCSTVEPKDETQIAKFVYYFLISQQQFIYDNFRSGSAQPHVYAKDVANLDYPILSTVEQKRVVERLDKAFGEIDDLVSLGDAEEANGISVMAAWLAETFSQDIKGSRNVLSLSAGGPEVPAKKGWKWRRLTEVAKLESGHTPSRKKPEYWGGEVNWVGIRDARESHGSLIHDTLQYTNELGIQNSSARILPSNTVCLSRTASVGYVFRLGVPMATSQDFINWVCGDALDPAFLQLLFMAEGEDIRRFGSGATHKTIYFSTAKSFYICIPDVENQKKIVAEYQSIVKHQKALVASINQKNGLLKHLKASILKQELTPSESA